VTADSVEVTDPEQQWLQLARPQLPRGRTFGALAILGSALFCLDAVATIGGTPTGRRSLALAIVVAPVPVMLWWGAASAAAAFRRPVALLASAATMWLLGALVWSARSILGGGVSRSPGLWDAFFAAAQLLVIVALIVTMRSLHSLRQALLDTAVVVAAGLAVGAVFLRPGHEHGATATTLLTLSCPILSISALMLILSAALGSSTGIPFSIAMFGLAEIPLTTGNLIHSYAAIRGAYFADRWADLAWAAAAIVATVAASVLILGLDRPIRLPTRSRIPKHAAGAKPIMLLSAGALALALTIACYGVLSENHLLALVGLIAGGTIGLAMALRARDSIRTAEDAYRRLDQSLAERERAGDALALANEELGHANVQLQAMHVAFAELLNLADERANGRMRALIEETGGELAELLEEQLELPRR
jgi:hypothetical protein